MMYLLYGPDTYRSRRKLNEIIAAYREKAGTNLNFHTWDVEESDIAELKAALETSSLFASKKLIVARRLFSNETATELLRSRAKELADSKETIVVFWEETLGKEEEKHRKKLEPFFARSQEFKALEGAALTRWIRDEAGVRSVRLMPAEEAHLMSLGGNLWATQNELDKLALVPERTAARSARRETTVFEVGDTFFVSPERSLRPLLKILFEGHDEMNLFSYLVSHARTLFTVKTFSERERPIPKEHGIHPFVVKKTTALVRHIPAERLYNFFRRFFEEDHKIKTGQINARDSLSRMAIDDKQNPD